MSKRVLIAGGGVAGVEAALALSDMAGGELDIEICAPRGDFIYRPFAVGEPYGASHPLRYDLEELTGRCGASYRRSSISSVDAERKFVTTPDGEQLPYDFLVIASGVKHLWAVPGAVTFWGIADEFDAESVVRGLGSGQLRHLVFAMPASLSWSLPLYELALLAQARQSGEASMGTPTRISIVTPEEAPLLVFGRGVSEGVSALLEERDIEVLTGTHPVSFDHQRGVLAVAPGRSIEADGVITLPRLEGRRIRGIPHDEQGFVPTDDHGRVPGLEGVYAAGDITTFPVKQGGIASQQADVVAEAIAVEVGREFEAQAFDPILRGVLWTGTGPRYLYGRPAGGHGEISTLTEEPPWPPQEGKIMSRYLSRFLGELEHNGSASTA